MNSLEKIYSLTKKLESMLEQPVHSANRESFIQEINKVIEQREEFIQKLSPPYSTKEKQLGKEIVCLNKKIEEAMDKVFVNLKLEIQQIRKQKKSNRTYLNPFKSVQSIDGVYLDRRN